MVPHSQAVCLRALARGIFRPLWFGDSLRRVYSFGLAVVDRRLRDAEQTATTPVLLLTAKTQERDVESGFGAGAGEYMTKPFSPRELLVRVKAMLARSQS